MASDKLILAASFGTVTKPVKPHDHRTYWPPLSAFSAPVQHVYAATYGPVYP